MIEKYEADLIRLADWAWEHPEPGFREFESGKSQVEYLRAQGFAVVENAADTVTGYVATWGAGAPHVAFLAEFDALYGLSQQADVTEPRAVEGRDMGHGCGHHLLGVGAIAAGLLFRDILMAHGCSGTVKIFGCPGEESGSGKAYLARDGFFDDCDVALTWHPSQFNMISTGSSQSCIQCYFRFHGVSAHAAGAPHLGRSALDACELMNVGVNYLREHMEDTDRVHYAYADVGSKSPNVVQADAELRYFVRSTTNPKCLALYERVKDVARGAALMTGTTLEIRFDEGLSNVIPNFALEDVYGEAFRELGVPGYTHEERAYAKRFRDTYDIGELLTIIPAEVKDKRALKENIVESELCDIYVATTHDDRCSMGSTDVGDVSWVIPTAQINVNCFSYGAGAHSWQWVAEGKSSVAHKGMLHAGKLMARAAEMLLDDPARIEEARAEFEKRLDGDRYQCLIPDDVKPHYFS